MADDTTSNDTYSDATNTNTDNASSFGGDNAAIDATTPSDNTVEPPQQQPVDPTPPTEPTSDPLPTPGGAPMDTPIDDGRGDVQMTDPLSEGTPQETPSDSAEGGDPDASQPANVMPQDENDGTES